MSAAGRMDRLCTFRMPVVTRNALGGESETFGDVADAWCSVRFGSSSERREAAGGGANQMVTFRTRSTEALRSVNSRGQIIFESRSYAVSGPPASVGAQGHELEFTAMARDPES